MATSETEVRELEREVVVSQIEDVADGVRALVLRPLPGETLPAWQPGAHLDLIIRDDLERQYSLCGDPNDAGYLEVAVLRESKGRGGSEHLHTKVQPGERIRIRGPRNHFSFETSERYLFVAGGIGITPILPMISAAEAAGAEWHLYYLGRSRGTMAFLERLRQYGDKVTLLPKDEVGPVDIARTLGTATMPTLVYCCGPERLINAVEDHCRAEPYEVARVERFVAQKIDTSADEALTVTCARSGKRVRVREDQSIFDALRDEGVRVLGSCLEGLCGTCETRVIDGTPRHRDHVLNQAERESGEIMMICVSRAEGDELTLDI